jgi:hypothetical protein
LKVGDSQIYELMLQHQDNFYTFIIMEMVFYNIDDNNCLFLRL